LPRALVENHSIVDWPTHCAAKQAKQRENQKNHGQVVVELKVSIGEVSFN
jgi:hypothetical protein